MRKMIKLPVSREEYATFKVFMVNNHDGLSGAIREDREAVPSENTTDACVGVPWSTRGDGIIIKINAETENEECYLTVGFHKGQIFIEAYKQTIEEIPVDDILIDN